jgi:two-component system, response regulator FlrC
MAAMRVLVVESDKQVRQFINETLTQEGYEVVEADTAEQGLKAMHRSKGKQTIDVVLCNRQVPSKSEGDPLMQFLAQRPSVPVVMLADHADLHYATQMFRQGVVDYLVKPIQAYALVDVVRHTITLNQGQK